MKNAPTQLVSVVIPCYNLGSFLGEAIESVLRQSYHPFEIIVVDDGSSDDTSNVATRYPVVRYIHQENQGPSVARNTGLRETKGQYLVFLDADDRLLPNALEVGVHCLESHPDCAFVSGHIKMMAADGSPLPSPEERCIAKDHYRALLEYNYIWTPAVVMFRSSVFEITGGYSPDRFGAEDWELYLRLARRFSVHCHDQVVAEYRVRGRMTSSPGRMLKDSLATLKGQWPFIRGNKSYEDACRHGIRVAQDYYGQPLVEEIQSNLRASQWKRAMQGARVLLRYDPRRFVKQIFDRSQETKSEVSR